MVNRFRSSTERVSEEDGALGREELTNNGLQGLLFSDLGYGVFGFKK